MKIIKKLIYFSTLSINDRTKQNSHYILHKLNLENYIQNRSDNYLILRVGNIVGKGGNPNTLFNFLKEKISHQNQFVLHTNARRLFVDINDISDFLKNDIGGIQKHVKNFAYPHYYTLKEIIDAIQKEIGIKAIYKEINEGDFYQVDFDLDVIKYFTKIHPDQYLKNLVNQHI